MKLHEAIEKLLIHKGIAMTAREIADSLNANKWYTKGDKTQIKTNQITARVNKYMGIFEIDRTDKPLKIKLFIKIF